MSEKNRALDGAIKITKIMIDDANKILVEAVREENYSKASEMSSYISGLSQGIFNMEVSKSRNERKT